MCPVTTNGHLISQDPRSKICGVSPVRVSRYDNGRVQPVAMYLPAAVATAVGVGSLLAGFEVRIGTIRTAKRDARAASTPATNVVRERIRESAA